MTKSAGRIITRREFRTGAEMARESFLSVSVGGLERRPSVMMEDGDTYVAELSVENPSFEERGMRMDPNPPIGVGMVSSASSRDGVSGHETIVSLRDSRGSRLAWG
jgi:hypothetical protein